MHQQINMPTTTFLHLNEHKKIPIRDATERKRFLSGHNRFATACGLALQGLGMVPFDVNLLPQETSGLLSRLKGVFSKKRPSAAWGMDIGNSCVKAVRVVFDHEGIPTVDACYQCVYRLDDPGATEKDAVNPANTETLVMQALQTESSPFAREDAPIVFRANDLHSKKRLAIEGFLHQYEYQGETICVGYPSQNLICSSLALEADTPEIAAKALPYEIKKHLPFDQERFMSNYVFLGSDQGTDGETRQCVHLFSTQLTTMEDTLELLEEFGIVPNVMTTNLLANLNYSTFLLMSPPVTAAPSKENPPYDENFEPPDLRSILICDMGAFGTDLVFYNLNEILHYYIPIGGNHFTQAIAKALGATNVQAEGYKRNPLASEHGPAIVEALKPLVRKLVDEVTVRLERFRKNGSSLDKIVVMGSGFQLQGFADYFRRVLEALWTPKN